MFAQVGQIGPAKCKGSVVHFVHQNARGQFGAPWYDAGMHLLRFGNRPWRNPLRAVLGYAVLHQLRQRVRSFDVGQLLVLSVLLMFDALLFVVAWFSWATHWPVALVFTLPFIVWTGTIIFVLQVAFDASGTSCRLRRSTGL